MQNLFLVSRGFIRPSLRVRTRLASLLSAQDLNVSKRFLTRRLLERLDPAETEAVILLSERVETEKVPEPAEPGNGELLDRYLLGGGGLLIVGGANAPDTPVAERRPVAPVNVRLANEFSRVYDGIGDFAVKDILFIRTPAEDVDVHFDVESTEAGGQPIPLVWTRYRGKGRLCCIGLSMRAASIRNPFVRKLIIQSVDWLLAGRRTEASV
jgi:hypothetical protein